MKKFNIYSLLVCTAFLVSGSVTAAEPNPQQQRDQYQLQDRDKYGWELMSEQERIEHREKMRTMKTEQERDAYRMEHHKMMQERAKERGVTIPDKPMSKGSGQGMGMGGGGGKNR